MRASADSDLTRRFTGKHGTIGVHTQLPRDGGTTGTDCKVDGDVKVDVYFDLIPPRLPLSVFFYGNQTRGRKGSWSSS
jgi:hypothetical protein